VEEVYSILEPRAGYAETGMRVSVAFSPTPTKSTFRRLRSCRHCNGSRLWWGRGSFRFAGQVPGTRKVEGPRRGQRGMSVSGIWSNSRSQGLLEGSIRTAVYHPKVSKRHWVVQFNTAKRYFKAEDDVMAPIPNERKIAAIEIEVVLELTGDLLASHGKKKSRAQIFPPRYMLEPC